MRTAALLLVGALVAVFAASASSVVNNGTRLALVAGIVCGVAGVAVLARRFKPLRAVLAVAGLAAVVVAIAPVRTSGPALQARMAVEVRAYEGLPYVWGGESKEGVDCSGLPRSARRTAATKLAVENVDPGLLRVAAVDWLVDVPARGMLEGRGTERVAAADRAALLPPEAMVPGTLVNTADGSHVMVVLDEKHLIEADPLPNKVIVAPVDDQNNPWMNKPVVAVRFLPP